MVSISGGQKPAIRIQANPTALSLYGLTLEDLRVAIAQANVNQPKGFRWPPAGLHHWGQRSAPHQRRLPCPGHCVPERRTRAAV